MIELPCDLVVTLASGEQRRFPGVSRDGVPSWHVATECGQLVVWPQLGEADRVTFGPGEWTEAKRV